MNATDPSDLSRSADPTPSSALRGCCRVLVAAILAERVEGEPAARLVPSSMRPVATRHKLAPRRLGVGHAPPLRWTVDGPRLEIADRVTSGSVEVALFDSGACVLGWNVPFESTAEELVGLAAATYEHRRLLEASRALLEQLARHLEPALVRPADVASGELEDYVLFELAEPDSGAVRGLLADPPTLARVLRAERGPLSEEEVADATMRPAAYTPGEGVYVDWLGALLVGEDTSDERFVLEAATVELLHLRHLEAQLMSDLRDAESVLAARRRPIGWLAMGRPDLGRVARRQVRDATTHEGVDNALGLLGDDYLARVYRRAAERFHLADWDNSIQRKLAVLDGIYGKLTDAAAQRRSELLEWVIILLIALEIVLFLG